jgi:hypothetical protein
MNIVISTNGGHCLVEDVPLECPRCECKKFKLDNTQVWTGQNQREAFMVAICDKCGKTLDISVEVG